MRKFFLFMLFAGIILFWENSSMAKEIILPEPVIDGEVSLEKTIVERRSIRSFTGKELEPEQIGQLLWSAQGVTGKSAGRNLRSAPSAGATYPMEIYAVTAKGMYRYLPEKHALEIIVEHDLRNQLAAASMGQGSVRDASINIVICALPERITPRYGERGIRYIDMEAGHIAQNVHLQAVALGLGSVPIGAFNEDSVKQALGFPKGMAVVYMVAVGEGN